MTEVVWDSVRKEYQEQIKALQASIDSLLRRYAETNDMNFLLFANHDIKKLTDLKDYIVRREHELNLVKGLNEVDNG